MHTIQFWRLDGDDHRTIERLAAGLGRKPARVLAYLMLRAGHEDDPATGLEIRIGTDLNRNTVSDALERLEDRDLLSKTTLPDDSPGRPPKAWCPDLEEHRSPGRGDRPRQREVALRRRAEAVEGRDGHRERRQRGDQRDDSERDDVRQQRLRR